MDRYRIVRYLPRYVSDTMPPAPARTHHAAAPAVVVSWPPLTPRSLTDRTVQRTKEREKVGEHGEDVDPGRGLVLRVAEVRGEVERQHGLHAVVVEPVRKCEGRDRVRGRAGGKARPRKGQVRGEAKKGPGARRGQERARGRAKKGRNRDKGRQGGQRTGPDSTKHGHRDGDCNVPTGFEGAALPADQGRDGASLARARGPAT